MMTWNDHAPPEEPAQVHAIDPPGRKFVFAAIMLFVALEPVFLAAVMLALGVPWWIVACVLGGILALVALSLWLIKVAMWSPRQRRYPAQPILSGAVSQSWQSIGFGRFMRMSNCLTIIADEKHLHLVPFAPLGWLGAARMSLPLDRMQDVKSVGFPRFQMSATLDGREIYGPEWCLKLADSNQAP